MGKIRKGVLYTISILLIAASFLYLTTLISSYTNSLKNAQLAASAIESINSESDVAEYSLKNLFLTAAVPMEFQGYNLSMIMNTSLLSGYNSDFSNAKEFLETYAPENITIDSTQASIPIFYLEPQSIKINYSAGVINITAQNNETHEEILGYEILIITDIITTPVLNWTALSEYPSGNPNAMNFHLGMQASNGTISETKNISRYFPSQLELLNQQNVSMITITVQSPSSIILEHNLDIYLNIIVQLNSSTSVELGDYMVNVSKNVHGEKRGKVIVIES